MKRFEFSRLTRFFGPSLQWRAVALRFPKEARWLRSHRLLVLLINGIERLMPLSLALCLICGVLWAPLSNPRMTPAISDSLIRAAFGWGAAIFALFFLFIFALFILGCAIENHYFSRCNSVFEERAMRLYQEFGVVGSANHTPTPALLEAIQQVKALDEARLIERAATLSKKKPPPTRRQSL